MGGHASCFTGAHAVRTMPLMIFGMVEPMVADAEYLGQHASRCREQFDKQDTPSMDQDLD